jgi:hypothetical protein
MLKSSILASPKVKSHKTINYFSKQNEANVMFYLQAIIDDIKDNKPQKDIISDVKELSEKNFIPEHEVIAIVS